MDFTFMSNKVLFSVIFFLIVLALLLAVTLNYLGG